MNQINVLPPDSPKFKVNDLRAVGPNGAVKTFKVRLDKDGNILRDKAGNPVLGKKVKK